MNEPTSNSRKAISDARKGMGCLLIFGGVFILAGMIPGYFALSSAWNWQQAKAWPSVPGQITSAGLDLNTDSDGTTYQVVATYDYQVDGRDYSNDRVGFSGGSDSFEDYHRNLYEQYDQARRNGDPVAVWYDPDDPQRSVLNRELRWGWTALMLLFPLLFGGAGIGIIAMGYQGTKIARHEGRMADTYPDQPWLWRPDWAEGRAESQSRGRMWFALIFAVFWNLISLPLLFVLPGEILDKGNYAAALGLLFPLVGMGLIAWAVIEVQRWRRFGRTWINLGTVPARRGGRLEGELFSPRALPPDSELEVRLSCIRKVTTGSGKNRKTREHVQWQDERRLRVSRGQLPSGSSLPFRFDLPRDLPDTRPKQDREEILWRVDVDSDLPGVDYVAAFDVPVFGEAQAGTMDSRSSAADEPTGAAPGDWRRLGLRSDGEGHWYVPAARHPGTALVVTLFCAVFAAVTVFLYHEKHWFFVLVFGFFTLLLTAATFSLWFKRSEIRARLGQLEWRTGHLSLGGWQRMMAGELESLTLDRSGSVGNRPLLALVARPRQGKKITLAQYLSGRRDSEAWLDEVKRRLGL